MFGKENCCVSSCHFLQSSPSRFDPWCVSIVDVSMLIALAIAAANIASFAGIGSEHCFLPSYTKVCIEIYWKGPTDCVSWWSVMIEILSEMDLKLNLWFHFVLFNYLVRGNDLYLGLFSLLTVLILTD